MTITNQTLPGLHAAASGGPMYRDAGEEQRTNLIDPLTNKTIFRKVVDLGNLPNTTTANVAHGITNLNLADGSWLRLDGYVTTGTVAENIMNAANVSVVSVDATNVNVTTGADLSGSTGVAIIEYTKT